MDDWEAERQAERDSRARRVRFVDYEAEPGELIWNSQEGPIKLKDCTESHRRHIWALLVRRNGKAATARSTVGKALIALGADKESSW